MGVTWFGHYRLDRLLGSGGTGHVWLAYDTSTDRAVALKVLSATVAAEPAYRQRFTREARLAAQVRGPHLAAIHSFGELNQQLYLDMEYIDGADLATVLRQQGPMAPARAVRIVQQVAQALDDVHRAGLLHRDVKPSNIMLGPGEHVHLINFGTAHRADQPALTTSSNVVGTLAYMAPERFSGVADARSDQYALACVLYECLTARRPFGNADAAQSLLAHLMTAPPLAAELNPAVPAALDAVLGRGMAKAPDRRCASAGELAAAAYAAVTGLDAPTVETSAGLVPVTTVLSVGPAASDVPRTLPDRPGALPVGRSGWSRSRVASGALIALLLAVALALWVRHPQGRESDSAARTFGPAPVAVDPSSTGSPAPTTVSVAPGLVTSEPAPAPIVSVPVAWQPCDSTVDGRSFTEDGTPVQCLATVGRVANWIPAVLAADKTKNPKPEQAGPKPGNGNNGNGHGKHGNDK